MSEHLFLLHAQNNLSFGFYKLRKQLAIPKFKVHQKVCLDEFSGHCISVDTEDLLQLSEFWKKNCKGVMLSSRNMRSGKFHCPGKGLAGTRDIWSHSETVPVRQDTGQSG